MATALLGNTTDAYGQVWHLPTDRTRLNAEQWTEKMAATPIDEQNQTLAQ